MSRYPWYVPTLWLALVGVLAILAAVAVALQRAS